MTARGSLNLRVIIRVIIAILYINDISYTGTRVIWVDLGSEMEVSKNYFEMTVDDSLQ